MTAAVIFDIDGTLIDSVDLHAQAWHDTLRYHGIDVPYERVRAQIGKGSDQLMPALIPEEILAQHGEQINAERSERFKRDYRPHVRAFPGVRALLERIRADGARIVLASSATGDDLEAFLRVLGVGDLIDAATTSDDVERSKPHPDIFEAALERLEPVDRSAVLVVGDTPYDAEAAGKAGLCTIGLTCGGWSEDELRAAGCIAVYRDPEDLLRQYDRSPLAKR